MSSSKQNWLLQKFFAETSLLIDKVRVSISELTTRQSLVILTACNVNYSHPTRFSLKTNAYHIIYGPIMNLNYKREVSPDIA